MIRAIRILDVVAITRDLPESGLLRGHVGTVVEELGDENWEVEFIDNNGRTFSLAAVPEDALIVLRHSPVGSA